MRHLRLLIIAIATIFVLALAAFALVNRPDPAADADDEIIIKGGSLEIDCGRNHGEDCMGGNDNRNKPKHRKGGKIVRIVVKKSNGDTLGTFTKKRDFTDGKPSIEITYREPRPEDN
ncbi:MAG TPA: hypothetical protein VES69_06565 [Pyrinomonadaceae bacterium]|nr:hypothetical protein [Pyrinomonadaceae bacterium]